MRRFLFSRASTTAALAVVLALSGCESSTEPIPGGDVTLRVHASLQAASVTLVVVEVTATDIESPLVFNFTPADGTISGTITVPAGSDRTIAVRAYDDGGVETHRGSVIVDLRAGTNPSLTISVFPLTSEQEILVHFSTVTLSVLPTTLSLDVGETGQLTATVTDAEGTPVPGTVLWATMNPGIARVDANGLVTAVGTGTVGIVATFGGVGASATITVTLGASPDLRLTASGLENPTFLASPPGDDRLFVVEQPGRVRVIEDGVVRPTPFLDLTGDIAYGGEQGMFSIAFHPSYTANGYAYVAYTALNWDVRVVRYTASADPNVAIPSSALPILTVGSIGPAHNGGQLAFGPDGMLYVSLGEGGVRARSQDLSVLHGKLLRLDIDGGSPYAIPPDNPFVGQSGARGEIWAFGLRNPWRFSFDRATGDLFIADVGESDREEVDVQLAAAPGGANYGWPIMEGSTCFGATECSRTGLTLPVFEYTHTDGCSITGGFVYRGAAIGDPSGHYMFADFCRRQIRSFRFVGGSATDLMDWSLSTEHAISSFGEDASGELYVLTRGGNVYKIVPLAS